MFAPQPCPQANITTLGPLVLPISEQLLFFVNLVARKVGAGPGRPARAGPRSATEPPVRNKHCSAAYQLVLLPTLRGATYTGRPLPT